MNESKQNFIVVIVCIAFCVPPAVLSYFMASYFGIEESIDGYISISNVASYMGVFTIGLGIEQLCVWLADKHFGWSKKWTDF